MLERQQTHVSVERSAKKEPLSDADAARLLAAASTVRIAKGTAIRQLDARQATLEDLKGPTGNYRAPMIVQGKTLLVGFNAEALESLL